MKIALVHDFLIQDGGAERVLQVLQNIWPEAPTYTLLYDQSRMGRMFGNRDIRTSFLQDIPYALRFYKWLMPLMPAAIEGLDLREYDVVLSSASAFAKGIITRPDTVHICYCHTPTRYLWSDTVSYVRDTRAPGIAKAVLPLIISGVRQWDRLAADRVDRFVANSETVAGRIQKYYRRDSTVIYPPVETKAFSPAAQIGNYYAAGGRLVAYKRFDLTILACNALGVPLKIFGEGPELERLRGIAGPNVEFVGKISEAQKAELYRHAIAFIHPQEEDFGITAVESMAAGRPVIAYKKGGAMEAVIEGKTGAFFSEQTPEALAKVIAGFDHKAFDPIAIAAHASRFDTSVFAMRIKALVEAAANGVPETAATKQESRSAHPVAA